MAGILGYVGALHHSSYTKNLNAFPPSCPTCFSAPNHLTRFGQHVTQHPDHAGVHFPMPLRHFDGYCAVGYELLALDELADAFHTVYITSPPFPSHQSRVRLGVPDAEGRR